MQKYISLILFLYLLKYRSNVLLFYYNAIKKLHSCKNRLIHFYFFEISQKWDNLLHTTIKQNKIPKIGTLFKSPINRKTKSPKNRTFYLHKTKSPSSGKIIPKNGTK